MKHTKLLVMALLCAMTMTAFAQDMSSTEKAIKQVIEDETKFYNERNYDAWANTWAHSDKIYWSVAGPETSREVHGWEQLSKATKEYFTNNPTPAESKQVKDGYNFMVKGDMAFVTFKEDGNMSTRVLAKKSGQWKLLRMGVVHTVAYKRHHENTMLKSLTGIWKLDPTTVQLSDNSWTMQSFKCKVKETDMGFKMYVTSDWSSEKMTGTWKDEYTIAYDSQTDIIGAMMSTKSPQGSSVWSGKCYVMDDYVALKMKPMSDETAKMKHKLIPQDDNTIKMHYVFTNGEGETMFEMTFAVVKELEDALTVR